MAAAEDAAVVVVAAVAEDVVVADVAVDAVAAALQFEKNAPLRISPTL